MEALRGSLEEVRRRSARLSRARTATFLGGAALLLALDGGPAAFRPLFLWGGAALLLGFVLLVLLHARGRRRERALEIRAEVVGEGPARLARAWSELPHRPGPAKGRDSEKGRASANGFVPAEAPAYAEELDVTGHASLEALLGAPASPPGAETLRRWLLAPAPRPTVQRRQEAVRELAERFDFREDLGVLGRSAGDWNVGAYRHLLRWLERDAWISPRPALLWAARLLPVLTLLLAGAHFTGAVGGPWWLLPLAVSAVLVHRTGGRAREELVLLEAGEPGIRTYGPLFRRVEEESFEAPLLRERSATLSAEGGGEAHRRLGQLTRLLDLSGARHSILHGPLNLVVHWDLHVLHAIEGWRRAAADRVPRWLGALGEIEALASLGTLAHDHPDWAFPELRDERAGVEAVELGHPLLPPAACVRNDVEIPPAGRFLLITGSNMSGKSTLLRAVGTNVVLALAGGPVCAEAMSLTPLRVRTSMAVRDSLEDGVSHFMAEVERAAGIVRDAEASDDQPPVLFLLDELLQGTNTAERRIAARTVVLHLIRAGAVGAITTHDLTLAAEGQLAERSVPVHLTEGVESGPGGARLAFDFRLRPGIATSTNALTLLRLAGLEPEEDA